MKVDLYKVEFSKRIQLINNFFSFLFNLLIKIDKYQCEYTSYVNDFFI